VLCHLKVRRKKFRIYLCHPVYLGIFQKIYVLFRFVTKQICLFRLFRYRFETPKQTELCCFWFHKTNRNKRETDLVSVCFGSNRNLFLIVSRTPYPPSFFFLNVSPIMNLKEALNISTGMYCNTHLLEIMRRSAFKSPLSYPSS
jgi:hypothetical protein